MTDLPRCPCCHGAARAVGPLPPGLSFAGRVLAEPLPGGTLYRCPACDLAFRAPRPSPERLNALYRAGETAHWQYTLAERDDWRIALGWLARRPPGRVLDIGCFDGAFLAHLPEGWSTYGVEIDAEAARKAAQRGVTLVGSDANALEATARYDAITAFDLIEHLANPFDFLATLRASLAPGGALIIGTGTTDARTWRWMGSRYWYCAVPEHLSFVSQAWYRWAAERLGLRILVSQRYSHHPLATVRERLRETGANALHRVAPPLFRALARVRNRETAGADVPGAADTPATWMSARDHLLVILQAEA